MGIIANKIRKAILGTEVRENIAEGIEVVEELRKDYDNQVINAGNSNSEIVDARGGEAKLKDRLDNFNSQLEQKANKSDVSNLNNTVFSHTDYIKNFEITKDKKIVLKQDNINSASVCEFKNINKLIFTATENTKWLGVSMGEGGVTMVNLQGLSTRDFSFMRLNPIQTVNTTTKINVAPVSVGDVVEVGFILTDVVSFKIKRTNSNSFEDWFSVKLSEIVATEEQKTLYLKEKRFSFIGNATTTEQVVCTDFMGKIIEVDYESGNENGNNIINSSEWKGKTFVSLGDSITFQDGVAYGQGIEQGEIAKGYQTILQEKLGFLSYLNKGVSGRPIANGSANGDGTNATSKTVDYSTFDLVTIAGGTNDFKLNIPLGNKGNIGDTSFDKTTFYGAYRDMLEYILVQKPSIRITLFTPLQRDNGGYNGWTYTNSAGHKLIDYVNAIKEIGIMYGIPVCDMYSNSGFNKLTLAIYTMDGLHPNDVGYARIGNYASKFIDSIGL